jgi:UDP-N-acetylglucosamine 2-epimerase (non-hydrolysing)
MEAGNRCFDERVPEEVNRKVIDHCSSVLLPYTERSAENLVREGIARHRIFVTGNPIYEVLRAYQQEIDQSDALARYGVKNKEFILATMHRAENVDDPNILQRLCAALGQVADTYELPLILSVHPRLQTHLNAPAIFGSNRVRMVPAMPFFEFVKLEQSAALVLTDSGTVQEECAIFRVPVITIRDSTERPETVECGSNIVASTRTKAIVEAARYLRQQGTTGQWSPPPEYIKPLVADTIVRILLSDVTWATGASQSHGSSHWS